MVRADNRNEAAGNRENGADGQHGRSETIPVQPLPHPIAVDRRGELRTVGCGRASATWVNLSCLVSPEWCPESVLVLAQPWSRNYCKAILSEPCDRIDRPEQARSKWIKRKRI